ncbi:ABC transporter permease [Cohnella herbarum]|uniref:ABC transporter permease n=1 Tax=Cohnella herbarum TaxID=2728023 RepID=A0A7Z2VHX6_9BACL|nr:ABC transporter permease [Cohnella herbarum]QJD83189.1 ABC transporter permease [Cohnella herbarum]
MNELSKLLRKDPHMSVLSVITFVVIAFLILMLGDQFLSLNNLQSMAYQIPEFGLLAIAMALTMLTGGIDLSLIANAGLSGIVAAYFLSGAIISADSGVSTSMIVVIAVIAALVVSTICGAINGLLIAKLSVPPILATLGTMILFTGIGMGITSGQGVVGFPETFLKLGSGSVLNVPYVFIVFMVVAIIASVVLTRTKLGTRIYLYGENQVALKFSGIRSERLIVQVYMISGLLAGIAAIIIISRVNSAKVGYGDTYLLQAILVAVLGGVHPDGGKGKIMGVLLGLFLLQFLQSAFTLFSFTPYAKKLIWGCMLLLVMIINYYMEKWRTGESKFGFKTLLMRR